MLQSCLSPSRPFSLLESLSTDSPMKSQMRLTNQIIVSFVACELILRKITRLKQKDQVNYPLASVCFSFMRWPTKAAAVCLRLLHRSHLNIEYISVTSDFCNCLLSRFVFLILLTTLLRALWLENRFSDVSRMVPEMILFIMELVLFQSPMGCAQISSSARLCTLSTDELDHLS